MHRGLFFRTFPIRHTLFLLLLCALLYLAEQLGGRFWLNDFRVYYGAASSLLDGAPLYGVAHGLDSGLFKYAPIMALVFVPWAMLPYTLAASLHFMAIAGAFIVGSQLADRLVREHLLGGRAGSYWPLFLVTAVTVVHLHRELHLGNINMLLLAILLAALQLHLRGRVVAAGILIGLAILAKPHFLVLLPLLLLRQQWTALGTALLVLAAGLVVPAVFFGWDGNWALHAAWLEQLARHNAALIYLGGGSHEAVNTVYSFLHRGLLRHLGASGSAVEAHSILAAIAFAFGLFVLRSRWLEARKGTDARSAFVLELLLLIALVPSITLTDTEHFLFSLPLIVWVVHHLIPSAQLRWLAVVAVPVLFAYGGNWEDALGPLSDKYVQYGVLGIGNIGLLLIAVFLFERRRSNQGLSKAS